MEKQETGGIHRSKVRRLAIPDEVRTRKRSSIPRAKRPRAIADRPNVFVFKYSIVQAKKGKKARQSRTTRDFKRKFKVLYVLRETVNLKPRFEFAKQVFTETKRSYAGIFVRNMDRALRTAKK